MFRVDPAKVPTGGVRARCSVCGAVLTVADSAAGAVAETRLAPSDVTPPSAGAQVVAGRAAGPRAPDGNVASSARVGPRITPRPDAAQSPGDPRAPVAAPSLATAAAAPTVPSGPPVEPAAPAARRVNPFLANDPSQKARRLARALVSDLVAYQPQKREEGLRAGTLKELFRDEIRRSWEEYVAQVGAPLAESTTHFQEALNDVLAGGRKIF